MSCVITGATAYLPAYNKTLRGDLFQQGDAYVFHYNPESEHWLGRMYQPPKETELAFTIANDDNYDWLHTAHVIFLHEDMITFTEYAKRYMDGTHNETVPK